MTLNKQDLQEFQEIYKATYWTDISEEEALIKWIDLINLMKIALSPNSFDYGD